MAAALNLHVPLPIPWLTVGIAAIILGPPIWRSYILIRNVCRWLALVPLAYVGPPSRPVWMRWGYYAAA